jgi:predicted nucleic acid-binding protein
VVVGISSTLLADAFKLYKQRQDKAWGMVDCFSFVVMQARGCAVVLTFDEDFRQAGFETTLL